MYYTNRIVYAMTHLEDPGASVIDHIDQDSSNHHPNNLRLCTQRENTHNRRDQSQYGVGVQEYRSRFRAKITINGQPKCLGTFDTPEEAAAAYQRAHLNYCESLHDA